MKLRNERLGRSQTVHQTDTYLTRVNFFSDRSIYLERDHIFQETAELTDVFPWAWMLLISDFGGERVQLRNYVDAISVNSPTAIFLPPFSLARWRIAPGQIRWKAY